MRSYAISKLLAGVALAAPGLAQAVLHHVSSVLPVADCALLGDVDADGAPDFALSTHRDVLVFSGATGAQIHQLTELQYQTSFWESRVTGIEDLNGDGYADLAVANTNDIHVVSGFDGTQLFSFSRLCASSCLPGIENAGDLDGDGYEDLLVPRGRTASTGPTQVRGFSGRNGVLRLAIPNAGANFGMSVAAAGDFDDDGRSDVLVGMHRDPGQFPQLDHAAVVYSGIDGTGIRIVTHATAEGFGSSVCGLGDVDADGHADFAVGAGIDNNQNGIHAGSVWVYSGATGTLITSLLGSADSHFGQTIAPAGDVNGDGVGDLLVAAHNASVTHFASGSIHVYSGADWQLLHRFHGTAANDRLGTSIDGGRDVDRDGFMDVIASSQFDVRVFSLGSIGTPGRENVHGVSCAAPLRRPRIGFAGSADVGTLFDVELRGARPNSSVVLHIGNPAVVPLAALGLASCNLYTVPYLTARAVTDENGLGRARIALNGVTIGHSVNFQWAFLDPQANPFGVSLSDALAITIGVRP